MDTICPIFPDKPTGELAERLRKINYVVTDADGTMFTGAKATVNSAGEPSAELVQILVELMRAGVGVIPCTGRNRAMIIEDARVLGFPGYIAEMGGVICTGMKTEVDWTYFTGNMPYEPGCGKTPRDVICETGVVNEMLKRWKGSLEPYHDNGIGYEYREVTVALRGSAPAEEMQDMLDACGLPLYISDNGLVSKIKPPTTLTCNPEHPKDVHSYHITPAGVSKGTSIVRFIELSGLKKDEVLGAGDSPADCVIADAVGTFLFMCNGLEHERAQEELTARDNIFISSKKSTDGWVQAMKGLLYAKS